MFSRCRFDEAIARLKVSPDELERWHWRGWISWLPALQHMIDTEQDPVIGEIAFVRDVVRSGLPDGIVATMLEGLPKPFAYQPDVIAFSFRHGWIVPSLTSKHTVTDDYVEEWLRSLALTGQHDRLREICQVAEDLVADIDGDELDAEDEALSDDEPSLAEKLEPTTGGPDSQDDPDARASRQLTVFAERRPANWSETMALGYAVGKCLLRADAPDELADTVQAALIYATYPQSKIDHTRLSERLLTCGVNEEVARQITATATVVNDETYIVERSAVR
jgi:hypothetical protein